MAEPDDGLIWTPEATVILHKIPFFVRSQARHRIEELARERGCDEVTAELVEEARHQFGQ
jgi:hypothetical protein